MIKKISNLYWTGHTTIVRRGSSNCLDICDRVGRWLSRRKCRRPLGRHVEPDWTFRKISHFSSQSFSRWQHSPHVLFRLLEPTSVHALLDRRTEIRLFHRRNSHVGYYSFFFRSAMSDMSLPASFRYLSWVLTSSTSRLQIFWVSSDTGLARTLALS